MNTHRRWRFVVPLTALALTLLAAPPSQAQYNSPSPPQVYFRSSPHWIVVPGTRVSVIRRDERPAYDMFGYGSYYYIYSNGYWYRSNRWDGAFQPIDDRDVPAAFYDVPRSEWMSYPPGWDVRNDMSMGNDYNSDNLYRGAPAPP